MATLQSFLTWSGGKKTLLNQLKEIIPKEYNDYYEPFLGSGTLLFYLNNTKKNYVCDINPNLINLYEVIDNRCDELINELKKYRDIFYENREVQRNSYKEIKSSYNRLIDDFRDENKVKKSAMFLYLNKSSYGSLYRVNKEGKYNVSFSPSCANKQYDLIPKDQDLKAVQAFLNHNTSIFCCDFEAVLANCKENDLVYFDPPYLNKDYGYAHKKFTLVDYARLKSKCDYLTDKRVKLIVTCNDEEEIRRLFDNYNIIELKSALKINSRCGNKSITDGKYSEICITNYTI